MELEKLIGKIIIKVRINEINTIIQFETNEGNFAYFTESGCCSESWINHISGIDALLGSKVFEVDEIQMADINQGEEAHSGRQEVDKIYSYKIFTTNGCCELEMRNSSNGYYGGNLEEIDIYENLPVLEKDF